MTNDHFTRTRKEPVINGFSTQAVNSTVCLAEGDLRPQSINATIDHFKPSSVKADIGRKNRHGSSRISYFRAKLKYINSYFLSREIGFKVLLRGYF